MIVSEGLQIISSHIVIYMSAIMKCFFYKKTFPTFDVIVAIMDLALQSHWFQVMCVIL